MNYKPALVIPWYGEAIPGGAEALCRSLAKAFARDGMQVEILSTCVREFHADWSTDHHPPGLTIEGGIPVRRFRVRRRDTAAFDRVNAKLMRNEAVSAEEEEIFVRENITSPDLCQYIDEHRAEYVFLFIPYMFGTTYWGGQVCPERSVLIPCLHEESYARMRVFAPLFRAVRGIAFNAPAEQRLTERLYGIEPARGAVVGAPVESGWTPDPERFRYRYGLSDFLLYAGRTDSGKNVELLLDYFTQHLERTGSQDNLVFIGERPSTCMRERIHCFGYLPEQDKWNCYAAARALCVPSVKESFSMVLMESWLAGRPAIVNAGCEVTADFCRLSNGGLYFDSAAEFSEILVTLRASPDLATRLGQQGRRFVLDHYVPEQVAAAYRRALETWF